MPTLEEIKGPIAAEMEMFEQKFRASMKSAVPLLDRIMHYIVKRKGKQMRPMFVFFSAGMCGGITESTYHGASLIELLHTATLVHDDVVDDSTLRRGFFSVNALWKNKIAVLVGDYLLSRGLLLSVENNEFTLLRIVSQAVREMSEGELLQIEKARRFDISEQIYFDIIRQKTASLIASCCACGAASAGAHSDVVEQMRICGEYIGIAFQVKDDLFDFDAAAKTGKPTGIDIRESKLTLPLITALANATYSKKKSIVNLIKNHHKDAKAVSEVIQFIMESRGIEYARQKMNEYQQKALDILNRYSDNVYKKGMMELMKFTIERTK